jgi:hypothetical protein
MTHHNGTTRNILAAAAATLMLAVSAPAQMDREQVLHAFNGAGGGAVPSLGLLADSARNLYGATVDGGNASTICQVFEGLPGCGVVYKLTPSAAGWNETVLYTFSGGSDGAIPYGAMVFDSEGNLYGTTGYGGDTTSAACMGSASAENPPGCGVVFKLTPTAEGPWTETVLHTFTGGSDGAIPFFNGVILDSNGDLYGETWNGGNTSTCFNALGCGVVYKLTHTATRTRTSLGRKRCSTPLPAARTARLALAPWFSTHPETSTAAPVTAGTYR